VAALPIPKEITPPFRRFFLQVAAKVEILIPVVPVVPVEEVPVQAQGLEGQEQLIRVTAAVMAILPETLIVVVAVAVPQQPELLPVGLLVVAHLMVAMVLLL